MKKQNFLALLFLASTTLCAAEGHYMQTKGEKIYSLFDLITSTIFGGLDHRGMTIRSLGQRNYVSWPRLDQIIRAEVANDRCETLNCPDYASDYASTTNSLVSSAQEMNLLIDGPESFAKRQDLIENARESIYFITWAIYDDQTGQEFKKLLLEKLRTTPDIDIRIIVDGQVSLKEHHFAVLEGLEKESDGRIQVMRWRAPLYRANGNHRKILIIDKEEIVMGGMNVGDVYSHFAGDDLWRDTDIHLKGSVARDAFNLFADVWNQQVKNNSLESNKLPLKPLNKATALPGEAPIVLNDHNPGTVDKKADHNITAGFVKLISEAQTSIDIENAYLILTTPVLVALKDAVSRGVQVRILTNSGESVDEPVVSAPILQSAKLMAEAGARVFLRKGSTLHSKFMIIDGKAVMIGSFNLHPRSHRYEGETMAVIFDENTAKNLTEVFEKDISIENARKIMEANEIIIPDSFLAKIARNLFFDLL